MLEINKTQKHLQIIYSYDDSYYEPDDWVIRKLKEDESVGFKRHVFTLTSKLLVDEERLNLGTNEFLENMPEVAFNIAEREGEYYKIYKGVLQNDKDIYLHKDIEPSIEFFIAESNISIFGKIAELVNGDIIIGGDVPGALPMEEFIALIESFPTSYEKKIYAQARISSILRNYFDNVKNAEKTYRNYRNKRDTKKGQDLRKLFQDYEVNKYQTIYDKLVTMLNDEHRYIEKQWQKEIIDILLLLYPKYISVFDEVPISADDISEKSLDFLFVDSNGHVDIVEIKQPFEHVIMTKGKYRDNHIPLRELSGTVMQIEKYIYYLNRWGKRGETALTKKYKERLPDKFLIHITNPKGFIIMGRENNLTPAQKNDFEVVKRKYKNVIDILSYDDLLLRLKLTIEQIKSK